MSEAPRPVAAGKKRDAAGAAKLPGLDPLLTCLAYLSEHHGHARSAEALRAGLAYDEKGMGPALFVEAAQRIGLKARIVRKDDPAAIDAALLPVVIILKNGGAAVLLSRDTKKKTFRLMMPGEGIRELPAAEAAALYNGYAILVHPEARFLDPQSVAAAGNVWTDNWFWPLIRDNRALYNRVALAAVLINLFGLVSPLYMMNVYNRVIPNAAIETGWALGIGVLIVFAFDFIMRTLRGYFVDLAGRRIDVVASRQIYDQVLNMRLAYKPASGGAFANMLREFDSVRDFLTSATLTAVIDLPFTFLFLLFVFIYGGPIALMITVLIAVAIGAGMMLQWPLKQAVARANHAAEIKHGLLVETIGALESIKAIGADARLRARYGAHVGEAAALGNVSRFYSGLTVNVALFAQQTASVFAVLIGMYLVRDGDMTMGTLIACVMLGGRALAPIGQVANLLTRYYQARNALKALNEIMARPVERPLSKTFLHRPGLKGKITFDRVGFAYPGTDRKVLDGVSFTIHEGERVAVIGRIGSGKSTIARLMLGLYEPQEGTLLADDTDYRQIDPADLRRNIAYIAQDIVLFRGTVRENITIAKPQATDKEILEAAASAGVHDFIARHPLGYDAPVGERGEGLSGGQRQAIALARAMLMKPQVFVCDEPTNAMDMQAEEAFTRHIRTQAAGRTLVLITHRQNLLTLVDRLILIDQGRVVMDGPRDTVIQALAQNAAATPKGET